MFEKNGEKFSQEKIKEYNKSEMKIKEILRETGRRGIDVPASKIIPKVPFGECFQNFMDITQDSRRKSVVMAYDAVLAPL